MSYKKSSSLKKTHKLQRKLFEMVKYSPNLQLKVLFIVSKNNPPRAIRRGMLDSPSNSTNILFSFMFPLSIDSQHPHVLTYWFIKLFFAGLNRIKEIFSCHDHPYAREILFRHSSWEWIIGDSSTPVSYSWIFIIVQREYTRSLGGLKIQSTSRQVV